MITIYWAGSLDETNPRDLVNLFHEVVHVEQFHRYGGESGFACEYGAGYLAGGGELPPSIRRPTAVPPQPAGGRGLPLRGPLPGRRRPRPPELLPDP